MDTPPSSPKKQNSFKLSNNISYINIDVPDDSDCLFSASLLGLLLPYLEENDAFSSLCQRLLGDAINYLDITTIQACLHQYDGTLRSLNANPTFQFLLNLWRAQVANEMGAHPEIYKAYIPGETADAFKEYITNLKIPKKTWGGEAEICAIHRLSMHSIKVYQKKTTQMTELVVYQKAAQANTHSLRLFHTRTQSASHNQNYHYHYFLPKQVHSALFKRKKSLQPPPTSLCMSKEIHLNSPNTVPAITQPNHFSAEQTPLPSNVNPSVLNQYVVGKKAFPLGKANFSFIIDKGLRFIDKSLFIKDVLDEIGVDVKLIIRPRRFGKTTNMEMLATFADCTRTNKGNFFEKLKLWHIDNGAYRQHYQNYPVIFMTFKDIKPNKFDKAYNEFVRAIQTLYNKHTYLSESTALTPLDRERFESILFGKAEEADVKNSLLYLSEYLHKHHGKHCLLLIDEYDTPIQAAYNHDYYDDMVSFIQSLFGAGLKGNNHMHTAVMTGILKIAKENIFSDLNNVTVYGVLESRYSAYFGFLEPEVKALMSEKDWDRYKDDMTDWYGGHQIGEHRLYNPWSVLNCIHQHYTFNYYWATAQENALIETILQDIHPTLKQRLRETVERGTIEHTIDQHMALRKIDTKKEMTETEQRNFVLGYLLLNGYLSGENKAAITKTQEYTEATLSIPNLENYQFFYDKVKRWFPEELIPFEFKSTTESERQFTVKNPLIRRLLGHNPALRRRTARHIINKFLYLSFEFRTGLTQALERSQPIHAMTELYAFSQLIETLRSLYQKFQTQYPTELTSKQCVIAGKLLLFTTETEESVVVIKPELAKPCFDQAITLDPSNDEAYCCRGIVLMLTSKQIDDALSDLQQAIQLNPNNASAHFELGNFYGMKGHLETAESHFKKALALGFNAELCYLSWGNMLDKTALNNQAQIKYKEALAINPTNAIANGLLKKSLNQENSIVKLRDSLHYCRSIIIYTVINNHTRGDRIQTHYQQTLEFLDSKVIKHRVIFFEQYIRLNGVPTIQSNNRISSTSVENNLTNKKVKSYFTTTPAKNPQIFKHP